MAECPVRSPALPRRCTMRIRNALGGCGRRMTTPGCGGLGPAHQRGRAGDADHGPVTAKVCILAIWVDERRLFTEHALRKECQSRSPAEPGSAPSRARRAGRRSVKRHVGCLGRGRVQAADGPSFYPRWPFCTPSRSLGRPAGCRRNPCTGSSKGLPGADGGRVGAVEGHPGGPARPTRSRVARQARGAMAQEELTGPATSLSRLGWCHGARSRQGRTPCVRRCAVACGHP